jgi:hypothetical protein
MSAESVSKENSLSARHTPLDRDNLLKSMPAEKLPAKLVPSITP